MSMFCYQCQEAAGGKGCNKVGVCGKQPETAGIQDLLIYSLKGLAEYAGQARAAGLNDSDTDRIMVDGLFSTITNANFDNEALKDRIEAVLNKRDELKGKLEAAGKLADKAYHTSATFELARAHYDTKAVEAEVGVLATENEDVRSLRELVIYGLKGMAAYGEHALNLGKANAEIFAFIERALVSTLDDTMSADELVALVLETGKFGVDVMALLDAANTEAYGNPELTEVNIGTRNKPAILISGHDLKDMEELLKQTEGTGVDVYTHSEMLPANYYPAFKKYEHFVGNYGNAWWKQKEEFATFNGPVLFTTNCIVPPKADYADRVYTTGASGFPGFKHIADRVDGGQKDFSEIIEHAKKLPAPTQIEEGTIVGGFAHNQVLALADKVVDAVKTGAIKKFFVMAGCDGRMKDRNYYTEFAEKLPKDTVILTAGCAKYRYNKLNLGDIGGIPRVLDAGQCNDSYSLAVIALKLKEVFELNDINELPIAYNIAWYEQKAVIVLLALLFLGVKNIKLGPTLPAFLSPNVAKVLVESFGINGIGSVEDDLEQFLG
ncbi:MULTISPECIES: hydroxylamine reductase [unclassified Fusibacter]|uniref:hydroxylamine reductase n=1 Tax=unclassified Fusibacter TaxID=2624464 RepID=UPI001012F1F0|nr:MULTISPECIES: hydroxylamine reductase [unclassified Fusibacter]MCK8059233.1 hydroxylamine reductase [Fusibacter sp. A2]NPE21303.1 hydroxylamine reductase [Fusibacter sp. A1]RXV62567.1 hydroxylamine reductase [Fusibacter sp. A1]